MILGLIREMFHRRELREIQREKELKQAECIHTWSYLGRFDREYCTGVDIDFIKLYRIRCPKCDKEQNYESEREAMNYCKNT